jgi:hypothetical protein
MPVKGGSDKKGTEGLMLLALDPSTTLRIPLHPSTTLRISARPFDFAQGLQNTNATPCGMAF